MTNKVVQFSKKTITPDDLTTVKEFATTYGCSVSHIYKLHNKGLIKFYKRGLNKVSESEVLRTMEL